MNNHAVHLHQPESELMIHYTSPSSANAAERALSAPSAVDDSVVCILLEAYERGRELNAAAATPLSETSVGRFLGLSEQNRRKVLGKNGAQHTDLLERMSVISPTNTKGAR